VSRLDEIAERDGWRCWLCDEPVDPAMSVNDARGPSVDSLSTAKPRGKGGAGDKAGSGERLAHRGCNTKKGATTPVIRWPDRLWCISSSIPPSRTTSTASSIQWIL